MPLVGSTRLMIGLAMVVAAMTLFDALTHLYQLITGTYPYTFPSFTVYNEFWSAYYAVAFAICLLIALIAWSKRGT